MKIFGFLWMLLLVIMALLVGPTSGRHAYERDRRDADGDLAEVAAKLPDNLIPQWYAYYIFKNYVELIFFFFLYNILLHTKLDS